MSTAKLLTTILIAWVALLGVAGIGHDTTRAEHPCGPPGIWGDVNDNGQVNSTDALLTLRAAVGFYVHSPCGPYDVDCDHDIDSIDALNILLYTAGLKYSQFEPCPDIGTKTGGQ